MKKTIIVAQLLLLTVLANAQHGKESLQKRTVQNIKEKFPEERVFHIEYGQSFNRDFDSELFDEAYQDAKIKNQERLKAIANVPIYRKNRWEIMATGNYHFHRFDFDDVPTNVKPAYFECKGSAEFHYLSTEIQVMRFSQLFNKPILYMGSIKADGTEKDFGRVKGSLGFSFLLKKTKQTVFGLGAMAFIDPSEQFPYIPTLVLTHKFNNSEWELDMLLPDRLMFQRSMGQKGRLSIGTSLENTGFYIENRGVGKNLLEYTQLELKTGFMYEHRINHFITASVHAGLQNFLDSRMMEKGDASDDEIYTNSQDMTGYFQLGISFHPFAK